jgi:hypothetical protein
MAAPSSAVCNTMPMRRLANSLASRFLRFAQRQGAEIELEEVEGVQHGLADGAAAVQGIEDRDAVRAADAGLAERARSCMAVTAIAG